MNGFDRDDEHLSWPAAERRQSDREPAFKRAEIIFGPDNQVHKGVVLDESADGVLLDLGVTIAVPSAVMFRYNYGPLLHALNRWSVKTKIGLQFIDRSVAMSHKVSRLENVKNILETQGSAAAFRILRDMRFFENYNLQKTAEEAVAADIRLKKALNLIRH